MRFWRHKWVRRLVVWVLVPVVLGIGFYQYNYPTCTFRYKLTAEVMTPNGLKTGSSVIEVSYSHNADWGGGQSADLNMVGEAVYVDLGQGKNLFVTLRSHESGRQQNLNRNYSPFKGALDGYGIPLKAFGLDWKFGEERALCTAVDKIPVGTVGILPFENIPTLVSFTELLAPYTVSVVHPDSLAEFIGIGYAITNLKVKITTENPSETIEETLRWLPEKKLEWQHKLSTGIDDPLIDRLSYYAFKQIGMPIFKGTKK